LRNFLAAYRKVRRERMAAAGKTDDGIQLVESRWKVPGAWNRGRKWEWEKRVHAFDVRTEQQHRLEIEQIRRERWRQQREHDRMIHRRMAKLSDIIDEILAVPHS
jgi:hypothetical protein